MKSVARWYKVVLILVLFLSGMTILSVLKFFGTDPEPVLAPIPNEASLIIRIDAKTFWQKGVYSVIFEAENDTVIDNGLRKLINRKYLKKTDDILPLDVSKDIVVFKIEESGESFMVFAVQLTSIPQFNKIIKEKLDKNSKAFVIGHTGYIITGKDSATKSQLALVQKKIKSAKPIAFNDLGSRSDFITFTSGTKSVKNTYSIGIQQTKAAFTAKGTITGKIDYQLMNYTVKQTGVGITLASITGKHNRELKRYMPFIGKNEITGLSIDYQGVTIGDEIKDFPSVQGILPLPTMNGVFRFKNELNMDSIMSFFPKTAVVSPGVVILNEKKYQIQLLDKHTLFLGMDSKSVVKNKQKTVFELNGDLESLSKFDGSFFIVAILSNIGQVKSFTAFAKTTKNVDFKIKESRLNKYTVSGIIPFEDGKNSINEVLKMILSMGVIK
jgi:hypothetical protein